MFTFNKRAFALFIIVLATEIFIGLFVRDRYIRPYGGDVLVVVLMYSFWQSFLKIKPIYIIIGVTAFAFFIEFMQLLNIVDQLQISNRVLRIIIGSSFSVGDLVAYVIGGLLCLPLSKLIYRAD